MGQNEKWCCRLLYGAMGDIRQTSAGAFIHWPHKLPPECASPPLITVTRDAMTLTPEGANFILENLYYDLPKREITALHRLSGIKAGC